jgi:hypothetical protein
MHVLPSESRQRHRKKISGRAKHKYNMSTVMIIGDSWGVPNYYGPPGVPETDHTEFLLKDLGHTVYNCSINSGSNLSSLAKAERFVSGKAIDVSPISTEVVTYTKPADWLLWFHTEFFRELYLINYNDTVEDNISRIGSIVYQRVANFVKAHNLKTLIIGGQASLEEQLFNHITPDFYINDWRSEIVGKQLPNSFHLLFRCHELIPKLVKDKDKALSLLDQQMIILDAMQQSQDFPDNGHPGTNPHLQLSSTIHNILK